jgi:HPt (histidine-containing phosphotransfer) domain-containing protein
LKVTLKAFFKEVTPDYLERRQAEISSLQTIIDAKDIEAVKAEFHKIAGSGGGFGLMKLTDLAHDIEYAAIHSEVEKFHGLFEAYKEFLNNVELDYTDEPPVE